MISALRLVIQSFLQKEIQIRKSKEAPPGELVGVPKPYKGLVFGKWEKISSRLAGVREQKLFVEIGKYTLLVEQRNKGNRQSCK